MPRAFFQVLVLPYRGSGRDRVYAVLRRADDGAWQFVAGGGEGDETPLQAARREALEEAGIVGVQLGALQARADIPVAAVSTRVRWPRGVLTIPEFAFCVPWQDDLRLSAEHTTYSWLPHEAARARLTYESNVAALDELHGKRTS